MAKAKVGPEDTTTTQDGQVGAGGGQVGAGGTASPATWQLHRLDIKIRPEQTG